MAGDRDERLMVLTEQPSARRAWLTDLFAHREVLGVLARKDFQTRYKRASLGVVWAVAVPLLQGTIMAVVFSRVLRTSTGANFGAYVLSGMVAWSYFSATLGTSSTAIVDGSGLSEKVWFPRAILVIVPGLANLVGLLVSIGVLMASLPVLGSSIDLRVLWMIPAVVLLVAMTMAFALVLSALHVYFRDVRFLVQAALLIWLYVTPVLYPQSLLKGLAGLADFNPMTGVIGLFHRAAVGGRLESTRALVVSVVFTLATFAVGLEAQRRHDRLFIDLL
jgi:ABC-type polysaccharide/polyol phosphate export permease